VARREEEGGYFAHCLRELGETSTPLPTFCPFPYLPTCWNLYYGLSSYLLVASISLYSFCLGGHSVSGKASWRHCVTL